jgi:hypothetical protein
MVELNCVPGNQVSPGRPVWTDIMCMLRRGMRHFSVVGSWRLRVCVFVGKAQVNCKKARMVGMSIEENIMRCRLGCADICWCICS